MLKLSGAGLVCALALAAAGCSAEGTGAEGAEPNLEGFDFAAEETQNAVTKPKIEDELIGKGSATVPFGNALTLAVSIANGQTVSWQTSNGSPGVDTVLALFRRHDNLFGMTGGTTRVGIQTLAMNDDFGGTLYSSLSYTNNTGQTENAYLIVFAYNGSTGTADLSGYGQVNVRSGSTRGSGTAGSAFTSASSSPHGVVPDPWLFMFDGTPGQGNGAWNDNDPTAPPGTRDSRITGATSSFMWYVAGAYPGSSGTTTINY
jgi:hypothetical protein